MFERRLKIFLILIGLVAVVMVGRAAQLQVLQRGRWSERAAESMKRRTLIETRRGDILDIKGRRLAYDDACLDAAVDYRAIIKQPEWMKKTAAKRLPPRSETSATGMSRADLIKAEVEHLSDDIDAMWPLLAQISGKDIEEIDKNRYGVIQKVELRRKLAWYSRYQKALTRHEEQGPNPWYKAWLFDESQGTPQPDDINVTVAEQEQSHVILRDVDNETAVKLTKMLTRLPGLELKQSTHRVYAAPANQVLCHSLGHLSLVQKEDMKHDSNLVRDELRSYLPNDLMGKDGIEGLAEPRLRGSKGRLEKYLGEREWRETAKAVPGENVTVAIDIDLQAQIMQAFHLVHVRNDRSDSVELMQDMHGAAVVIDVPTGEVRALVSNPGFDLNRFDADYRRLDLDQIESPLLNRATCAQFPPGSTVKTIIGSCAVTWGKLGVHEGIECTGYLMVPDDKGRVTKHTTGRCWVASQFEKVLGAIGVAHHPVPSLAPHHGSYGNPDGFLVLADALERSCNVYFETVADRLRIEGVTDALALFGLGRRTGLGILEMPGRIPHPGKIPSYLVRNTAWFAGIGQGQVTATPIQMANVAATLARGGIWTRPKLVLGQTVNDGKPDRIDLHLAPEALAAVREGMIKVVHAKWSGTGNEPARDDIVMAAKTGSAQQTTLFSVLVKDENGVIQRDRDKKPIRIHYPIGSFPWYQGTGERNEHLAHAWFIGYAPAENPKIAFCVMVEYGGSGGKVAGPIVRDLIEACVEHEYLKPNPSIKWQSVAAAPVQ